MKTSIKKLITKLSADVSWENDCSDIPEDSIFSIDIEKCLKKQMGKPILFFATLTDVDKSSNKYSLYLTGLLGYATFTDYFILESDRNLIEKILENRKHLNKNNYVIVVNISGFGRPEQYDYSYDREVIIYGKCLELINLGDYYPILAEDKKDKVLGSIEFTKDEQPFEEPIHRRIGDRGDSSSGNKTFTLLTEN